MRERQMEGTLWKWTNYWSGWQPRWFILDKGVLSYYKSQEEVNEGCRGSFSLSVCDILVHPVDTSRLELNIPGEQRFFVKAATPKERQKWLIALGSAKAAAGPVAVTGEKPAKTDELRSKRSELRLYCDLLMQQVFAVKSAASEAVPDVQKLDEATDLLSTTCDQFIQVLEDVVHMSKPGSASAFTLEFPHQKVHDTPLPPTSPSSTSSSSSLTTGLVRMSPSSTSSPSSSTPAMTSSPSSSSAPASAAVLKRSDLGTQPEGRRRSSTSTSSFVDARQQQQQRSRNASGQDGVGGGGSAVGIASETSNGSDSPLSRRSGHSLASSSSEPTTPVTLSGPRCRTFFTLLNATFGEIALGENDAIPTEPFLKACEAICDIFDRLESSAFSPVKQDMLGHVRKVEAKMAADPKRYVTLQAIVTSEMSSDVCKIKNSATAALVWLTRGLWFIRELLWEVQQGSHDLVQSMHAAYSRTLRQHHSWVVRSVLAVALKAAPSRDVFLHALASSTDDTRRVDFERQIHDDIATSIVSMDRLLRVLDHFYRVNELEKKLTVES